VVHVPKNTTKFLKITKIIDGKAFETFALTVSSLIMDFYSAMRKMF